MKEPRKILLNLLLLFTSLFLVMLAGEIFLRVRPPRSEAFNVSLNGKKWLARYWKYNSDGFRDREHLRDPRDSRKLMLVMGDSFAAAHGVNNPDDRFSNLLGERLKDGWEVFTVAKNGWSTVDELSYLWDSRHKPDFVVLSYYINDIEGTQQMFRKEPPAFTEVKDALYSESLFHEIRKRSYLIDFVYWKTFHLRNSSKSFLDWIKQSYSNETVWRAHAEELHIISTYLKSMDCGLLVVIFPDLTDIEGSRVITSKVDAHLKGIGVRTLDLTATFEAIPMSERIVSNLDPHPNEASHKIVADLIYDSLTREFGSTFSK